MTHDRACSARDITRTDKAYTDSSGHLVILDKAGCRNCGWSTSRRHLTGGEHDRAAIGRDIDQHIATTRRERPYRPTRRGRR